MEKIIQIVVMPSGFFSSYRSGFVALTSEGRLFGYTGHAWDELKDLPKLN